MENLDEIKAKLTQLKAELGVLFHIKSLGLFGSAVRKDFSVNSDIDILVEFDRPIGMEFIELAEILEKRLERPVDLISKKGVKEKYLKSIMEDIVYV